MLFEKFGEMDSYKDINDLAENLFNEGDAVSIKIMAAENGIPEDLVDLYLEGDLPYLCDAEIAAIGKLDVESKALKLKGLMVDWVEYIKSLCMESDMMAHQVRKKGKSLKECMAALLVYSFQNRISVDKEIVKAANTSAAKVEFGIPSMGEAKRLIKEYYLGAAK